MAATSLPVAKISYTPLFRSQHEDRYLRRDLLKQYESDHDCRLIVIIDEIRPESITMLAEVLHGADPSKDLHLLLHSPGGDGEVAIRMARMAQEACRRLVVLVPDAAKSAATILCLGAHEILMGAASDLGPVDPQIRLAGRGYVGGKDLIQAVDRAMQEIAAAPDTFPLHAALLSGVDATTVEFARSAIARTADQARQALGSNPDRSDEEIEALLKTIRAELIDTPKSHGAIVGPGEASRAGLPVTTLVFGDEWWTSIWSLWTRYFTLGPLERLVVYESVGASQVQVL